MKKRLNYILLMILTTIIVSCDSFFDVKPTNIINQKEVWSDVGLIKNVLADLYAKTQYEDFNYFEGFWVYTQLNLTCVSDEAFPSWQRGDFGMGGQPQMSYGDEWFYFWPYDQIRNCNLFLEKIKNATIDENEKNEMIGEARFLRAFHYFHLVKRFGGVPLVTNSMVYNPENLTSLQKEREKEETIWNFILSELNSVETILPEKRNSANKNRINKYIAFALQSRAMLYAASIAQYGKVNLNGLVGIAADASSYWQDAYNASDSVISSGIYSLYKRYDDPALNYQQLFLDKENSEYIWKKEYVLPSIAHSFDKYATPYSFVGGYGCGMSPTLEFVESYEYVDGSEGILKVNDDNGNPFVFDNPLDLFKGKDPRLFASVYLPNSPCRGSVVEIYRGMHKQATNEFIKAPDSYVVSSLADGTKITLMGRDGIIDSSDPTKSGFYQKKFLNEKLFNIDIGKSDQPWPVFRLGEMYLNKAEAAFMLGKKKEALSAVNEIRKRAGIRELNIGELTIDRIRHERRIELAFENHRFWDLRRWRIAATDGTQKGILDNWQPTALYPWIVYENGKYIFTKADTEVPKPRKVFYEKNYYLKFRSEDMTSNKLLIQNPGY